MINASFLYFSRTLTNDYRWIYTDELLTSADIKSIMNDYAEFESNRDFFIAENHMIARKVTNGVVFYRFSKTNRIDQSSRKVYALSGVFFSGFDYTILFRLYEYIVSYFFMYTKMFEISDDEISDSICNGKRIVTFSLDLFLDRCSDDKNVLYYAGKVANYLKKVNCDNLIITYEDVVSMHVFTGHTTKPIPNKQGIQSESNSIKADISEKTDLNINNSHSEVHSTKNFASLDDTLNQKKHMGDCKFETRKKERTIATNSSFFYNDAITISTKPDVMVNGTKRKNIIEKILDIIFPH